MSMPRCPAAGHCDASPSSASSARFGASPRSASWRGMPLRRASSATWSRPRPRSSGARVEPLGESFGEAVGGSLTAGGRQTLPLGMTVARGRSRSTECRSTGIYAVTPRGAGDPPPLKPAGLPGRPSSPVRRRDRRDDTPLPDVPREVHRNPVDHVRLARVAAGHDGPVRLWTPSQPCHTSLADPRSSATARSFTQGCGASEPTREATIGSRLSLTGTLSRSRQASQGDAVGADGPDGRSSASGGGRAPVRGRSLGRRRPKRRRLLPLELLQPFVRGAGQARFRENEGDGDEGAVRPVPPRRPLSSAERRRHSPPSARSTCRRHTSPRRRESTLSPSSRRGLPARPRHCRGR